MKHSDEDTEDWRNGGFGLYLHWPFCQSKCPYCDFNSHIAERIDLPAWRDAYLTEIDRLGAETHDRTLRSVFLGGGTPSLMPPELVEAILERVRRTWRAENDIEITMEANPGSVEAGRFRGYRDAGVNRVSIGAQSLRDADLRRLGRLHAADEAKAAIRLAQNLFERVSFDLIYARQDQTVEEWRAELAEALSFGADHMSLYQLTIENGTVFAARHALGHLRGLPDEDRAVALHDVTQELCSKAGLNAYEVSNHARAGSESRHNIIYWTGGDYAGIGPGAHGRLTLNGHRWATEAPRDPKGWLQSVAAGRGELPRVPLGARDQALEYLMMGLRMQEGIRVSRLRRMLGGGDLSPAVLDLRDWGAIVLEGDHLRATPSGRLILNSVIDHLAQKLCLYQDAG